MSNRNMKMNCFVVGDIVYSLGDIVEIRVGNLCATKNIGEISLIRRNKCWDGYTIALSNVTIEFDKEQPIKVSERQIMFYDFNKLKIRRPYDVDLI